MANSTTMMLALAAISGLKTTTADAINRAMRAADLRSEGGKGRGASQMSGSDVFNAALAMVCGLGATGAPEFVRQVIEMEFKNGLLTDGDEVFWEANGDLLRSGSVLRHLHQEPMKDIRVAPTFGPFMSAWIEGLYDDEFAWKEKGKLQVVISHQGPTADVTFDLDGQHLQLSFAARGLVPQIYDWERQTILRGDLFRKLVKIVEE